MLLHAQALQREQEKEIMKLERELEERKFQHENQIRSLKTQFLKDKQAYEERAEAQVRAMANKADKVL